MQILLEVAIGEVQAVLRDEFQITLKGSYLEELLRKHMTLACDAAIFGERDTEVADRIMDVVSYDLVGATWNHSDSRVSMLQEAALRRDVVELGDEPW